MKEQQLPIESGTEFIESTDSILLNIDNINFTDIISVETKTVENIEVYDIEVENLHNYHVKNLGIVHNGGGR